MNCPCAFMAGSVEWWLSGEFCAAGNRGGRFCGARYRTGRWPDDDVGVQRDPTGASQKSTAHCCTTSRRHRGQHHIGPDERRSGVDDSRTGDLPKNVALGRPTGQQHSTARPRNQCAAGREDEDVVRASVQGQSLPQGERSPRIDPRSKGWPVKSSKPSFCGGRNGRIVIRRHQILPGQTDCRLCGMRRRRPRNRGQAPPRQDRD